MASRWKARLITVAACCLPALATCQGIRSDFAAIRVAFVDPESGVHTHVHVLHGTNAQGNEAARPMHHLLNVAMHACRGGASSSVNDRKAH